VSVVVGVLVALAVLASVGDPGRRLRVSGSVSAGRRRARPPVVHRDLSAVLLGVSAQLRAGASAADAWNRVLGSAAPTSDELVAATTRGRRRPDAGERHRVRAVTAATVLSDELGAPLAGVLERIASAVAADEEAEGERRAALSGPRATARVLAWLPVLGLLLGGLLGADPVEVVLSGGPGTVAAVAGVVLLLLGRAWTSALLARAARA
jgi:tight adherence protein B